MEAGVDGHQGSADMVLGLVYVLRQLVQWRNNHGMFSERTRSLFPLLTVLVLFDHYQRLWISQTQVPFDANADGSCTDRFPSCFIHRGHLRSVFSNPHYDCERHYLDDWHDLDLEVGHGQHGRSTHGPGLGLRVRRQHPPVVEFDQLQCGRVHEAKRHQLLDVCCILCRQYCRASILRFG